MPVPHSSILALKGVAIAGGHGAASALDFELGHREVALLEIEAEADAAGFVDLCLGLAAPRQGEVWCLGRTWHGQSYGDMLSHRRRIGTLAATQAWPTHLPVAQVTLVSELYHTDHSLDDAVAAATVLARRFGLPGLPTGTPETVHREDLVRAACVRAFLGAPEFVVIADAVVDSMPQLAVPLAQSIGDVRDRGGAVLWLVGSLRAPAARLLAASHVLRLGDRGLTSFRSPQ